MDNKEPEDKKEEEFDLDTLDNMFSGVTVDKGVDNDNDSACDSGACAI